MGFLDNLGPIKDLTTKAVGTAVQSAKELIKDNGSTLEAISQTELKQVQRNSSPQTSNLLNHTPQPTPVSAPKREVLVASKYEDLKPLVRATLKKDEICERDINVLRRKASALGLDEDEFEMRFEMLVEEKEKAGEKHLFRKTDYTDFFKYKFDKEYDKAFLTGTELHNKKQMEENQAFDMINSMGGFKGMFEMANTETNTVINLIDKFGKK